MGVAVRAYFTLPAARTTTTWSPGWSCGTASRASPNLLPGYGWVFGMGDGTVNVGLGTVAVHLGAGKLNYRDMLTRWLASTPAGVGLHARRTRWARPSARRCR